MNIEYPISKSTLLRYSVFDIEYSLFKKVGHFNVRYVFIF